MMTDMVLVPTTKVDGKQKNDSNGTQIVKKNLDSDKHYHKTVLS